MLVVSLLCHVVSSRGHSNNNFTPMAIANNVFVMFHLYRFGRNSSTGRQNTHMCFHALFQPKPLAHIFKVAFVYFLI